VDADVDDQPGYSRMRRRRFILLAVAILAVLASVGGVLVSTAIKSPAQQAAETKAPGLTRLTAPVQRTVIRNVVQANGVVTKPPQVSSLNGVGGGGVGGNVQQVVTKIYLRPGSYVQPGSVIIEVAGRPLFVLQGTVPAYRDIAPGDSGSDVAQLQAGLESLGFSTGGDSSGVYGPGTGAAVADFYHSIGYTVPTVSVGPKSHRGPEVPLAEIMFVPRFPAQVVSLGGKVGSIVKGSYVTLSLGRSSIRGQLNPAYGSLVRPGMHVTITAQGTGAIVGGTITAISHQASTAKSITGGIYLPMRIKPSGPLPAAMGPGQDVILSINAAKTSAPMLAVPEAAVFGGPDGRDYVSKVTGPGSQVKIQVRILTEGDGLVGISPTPPGSLRAGDLVVTGQNYLTSPVARGGKQGVAPGRSGRTITVVP
jgi:peptidoglycan hydrolase-like protein with peptidoglycan-binding domain